MTEPKSESRKILLEALTENHAGALIGLLEGVEMSSSNTFLERVAAKRILDEFLRRYPELVEVRR